VYVPHSTSLSVVAGHRAVCRRSRKRLRHGVLGRDGDEHSPARPRRGRQRPL